ncbi:MAG: hypothetical protein KGO81_11175 [Bacteroidota bacterium]|nr:hypothetical protein [Bacteroidota bacterium]
MRTIFFLRSYGDFIIAVYTIQFSPGNHEYRWIVSKHLEALFASLPKNYIPPKVTIEFANFKITHGIFAGFTNRFLFSMHTVKQFMAFKKFFLTYCKTQVLTYSTNIFFLEQQKRALIFSLCIGKKMQAICNRGNVYEQYASFWNTPLPKQQVHFNFHQGKSVAVLVFPGSRKKSKRFPEPIVHFLNEVNFRNGVTLNIARFEKEYNSLTENSIVYKNFSELIQLIQSADFIVAADSVVAHLSLLLGKPHWIMYPDKVNEDWLTPFAKASGWYCCFNEHHKLEYFLDQNIGA